VLLGGGGSTGDHLGVKWTPDLGPAVKV
jgi:hypothetical protein